MLTRGQLEEAIAGVGVLATKEVDFNAFAGDANPKTLFEVTGTVIVKLYAVCTEDLAGNSATIEVGTAKNTAGLIAQTTGTNIDLNEIWHDATPDSSVEASSVVAEKIVNQDIIQTVASAALTAGKLKYFCIWKPVSADGEVVAAAAASPSPSASSSTSSSPSSSVSPSSSTSSSPSSSVSASSSISSSPSSSVSSSASSSPSSSSSSSPSSSTSASSSASSSPSSSASTSPSSSESRSPSTSPSI